VVAVSHHDNSANNPLNPDATRSVKFGVNSDDEMMLCYYGLIVTPDIQPEKVFKATRPTIPNFD
jgi:hypothetical protein